MSRAAIATTWAIAIVVGAALLGALVAVSIRDRGLPFTIIILVASAIGAWLVDRKYFRKAETHDWRYASTHYYPECHGAIQVRYFIEDGSQFRELQCLGSCGSNVILPLKLRKGCES